MAAWTALRGIRIRSTERISGSTGPICGLLVRASGRGDAGIGRLIE